MLKNKSSNNSDIPVVAETWATLEAHLQKTNPRQLSDLNPPASDADLASMESELGCSLPRDFNEYLARHDGQAGQATGLFDGEQLLSIRMIVSNWRVLRDLSEAGEFKTFAAKPGPGVRANWWRTGWIPITDDGAGNHLCLDLDPAPRGCVGQVVRFDHDLELRQVQAESFGVWFAETVKAVGTAARKGDQK